MLIACEEIGQPVRIAPSQARNRIFHGAERLRVHGSGEDHGPIHIRWERDRLLLICCRERWTCSFCESWPAGRRTATASPSISRASPKTCFRWEKAHSTRHYSDSCSTAG